MNHKAMAAVLLAAGMGTVCLVSAEAASAASFYMDASRKNSIGAQSGYIAAPLKNRFAVQSGIIEIRPGEERVEAYEPRDPDEDEIIQVKAHRPGTVTLAFAGDLGFGENYANMAYYHSTGDDITQCIMPDLIERMDAADIMMLNNEFTYSDRGAPLAGKGFTFRTKPSMAANLDKLSVDIVSLANNHVYDYGEEALLDTLSTLEQYGVPYVGAGRNLEEAKNIVYFRVNGVKIAYVSATQIERDHVYTKQATDTAPGVLRTYDPALFCEVIREADSRSDFVVVYVHWGTEADIMFEEDQRELGRSYIDAGADLVIGDHTHYLQGAEYYNGVPIFYSLGNFWFNSRTRDTGLVEVELVEGKLSEFRFVPCLQSGCRTSLVTDEAERQRLFRFLQDRSLGVNVSADGVITEK